MLFPSLKVFFLQKWVVVRMCDRETLQNSEFSKGAGMPADLEARTADLRYRPKELAKKSFTGGRGRGLRERRAEGL